MNGTLFTLQFHHHTVLNKKALSKNRMYFRSSNVLVCTHKQDMCSYTIQLKKI